VSTVKQDDGAVNVFVGNGQALVMGNTANSIVTVSNSYDVHGTSWHADWLQHAEHTSIASGGTVGGLLDFRNQILTRPPIISDWWLLRWPK
jgi:flagellar hook-associated protein 1 FlgK